MVTLAGLPLAAPSADCTCLVKLFTSPLSTRCSRSSKPGIPRLNTCVKRHKPLALWSHAFYALFIKKIHKHNIKYLIYVLFPDTGYTWSNETIFDSPVACPTTQTYVHWHGCTSTFHSCFTLITAPATPDKPSRYQMLPKSRATVVKMRCSIHTMILILSALRCWQFSFYDKR